MANRNWTSNPDRKITSSGGVTDMKAGGSPSMPRKQSFTSMALPGPASHNFAKAKKGYREVNGYAAYKGLSQSTTDAYLRDAAEYRKARKKMDDYARQEEAGRVVVGNALRHQNSGYRADVNKLRQSDTAYGALYEQAQYDGLRRKRK